MEQVSQLIAQAQEALPEGVPPALLWGGLVVVVLVLVSLWLQTGRLAWRLVLRFVFGILVPVGLVVWSALFVVSRMVPLYPLMWQIIVGCAIFATALIGIYIYTLRERAEGRKALARVLHADIAATVAADGPEDVLGEYSRQMIDIMQANPGFVPLIPAETPSDVHGTYTPRLTELAPATAAAVTTYYTQSNRLARFAADMRGPAFQQIAGERRVNMYRDYVAMKKARLTLGDAALTALEKAVKAKRDSAVRAPRSGL